MKVVIQPIGFFPGLKLIEFWEYRELLYFLVWRDIKARYRQTLIGAGWAILQPLLTVVVFSFFFGHLAGMPSDGASYPLFVLCAMVPWTFFSNSLYQAAMSLVNNPSLITKVYFARVLIPAAPLFSTLIDFLIASTLLLLVVWWVGVVPSAALLLLPLFTAIVLAAALGAGLWLSALCVRFRDVRYLIPFLQQFWFFLSPVAYPASLLAEPWRSLFGLNPVTGAIEGFRWALLGTRSSSPTQWILSALSALLLLLSGLVYFRITEKEFADVI